jgi:hypothetical protein
MTFPQKMHIFTPVPLSLFIHSPPPRDVPTQKKLGTPLETKKAGLSEKSFPLRKLVKKICKIRQKISRILKD